MRLNKYIAHAGIASRRKADELTINGNVKINGLTMREPGYNVKPGDVVEDNGLEICASNLYYGNIKDIVNEKGLPKDISGKKDALVLILSITNKSEKEVKLLADFIPNVAMVGYPIGYYNQGYIYALDESEDLNMQSGETRKVAITFAVSNGLVRQERRKQFIKSDFYFDMSVYPIHKSIVFHGVEKV